MWAMIILLLGGLLLGLIRLYQFAALNVMRDVVRYKVYAIRDRLRRMAIDGEVDQRSFCYGELDEKLSRIVDYCDWLSLGELIEWYGDLKSEDLPPHVHRFREESSPELLEMSAEAANWLCIAMVVNSPGWLAMLTPFALIGGIWQKQVKPFIKHLSELPKIERDQSPLMAICVARA